MHGHAYNVGLIRILLLSVESMKVWMNGIIVCWSVAG